MRAHRTHGLPIAVPVTAARVWVLNFDAEHELESGLRQTPSRGDAERVAALSERVVGSLVAPGDAVLSPTETPARKGFSGARGLAWCPTTWAVERLERAGARLRPTPSMAVLAKVNHRRWAASLGSHLPRAGFVTTLQAIEHRLSAPWPEGGWLFKRALSFAGRGRLHLHAMRELDDPRRGGWIARGLREGGLMLEPHVERVIDLGLHGYLGASGGLWRGELTRQRCDARGQWEASERARAEDLSDAHRTKLAEVFDETAEALRKSGYWGPFNVDAFVWREGDTLHLQPRSEVNARYSMGWAVGMGALRPDLEDDG